MFFYAECGNIIILNSERRLQMALLKIRRFVSGFLKEKLPEFLNNTFEVTSGKRAKIAGAVVFVITLLFVIFSVNSYISQQFRAKWILLAFCLAVPFVLGLCAAYTVNSNPKSLILFGALYFYCFCPWLRLP